MTVKEMGGRSSPRVAAPSFSGGGFLVKLKVGAFPATFAAAQINRLLAFTWPRYGSKHGAGGTVWAWRRLLDLARTVAHSSSPALSVRTV